MSTKTLYCLLQNRLGAMDRVLCALTHRGIVPNRFVSEVDTVANQVEIVVTFDCHEKSALEKLVKFLEKQVYVLDVQPLAEKPTGKVAPMFEYATEPVYTVKRRVSHVNNA